MSTPPKRHVWLAGRERSVQCMSATLSILFGSSGFAQRIKAGSKEGTLWATSVGFRPQVYSRKTKSRPGGIDFIEQELMEFSIVSVPANAEALMELSAADKAQLRRMRELELIR